MKAVLCSEPGRLEIVDRHRPGAPAAGWARLAISRVGICGTDYHIFEGKHPFLQYPRVMGHEISATVVEAGPGTRLAPGTLVVVNPYLSCGSCIACRNGRPNCCTAIRVLGVHTDGAFCEEIVMPEENLYPAKSLSPDEAATVEFLAIGAHAVRRSGAPAGVRSLVIGAGPIGLGTAIFSRIAGHHVTLLDTSAERLAFASDKLGFSRGLLADEHLASAIAQATEGDGFDVVFDATGNGGSMERSFAHVAHGGTLVFVSVVKDEIRFSDPEFHKREMTLVASRNATHEDFQHVIASIGNGLVPVEALITHRTTLEEAVYDLPRWAHDKRGLVKAVIRVGAG
ncbi:zinc-binding alcohol dehydrogenase family protein [Sinorhizobium numidicum]|uniref:Zinc-binding alcohol dehydrogenase family protein n=1 Tax=Sinorhizobium numidicum TaxID=680248 RepID=A0ABY8D1S7_9HYPH|nr:zinc-binding alcohol dehydrogenase family protein [Sinorhizobium numidicum]WEX77428.1 zinc-binding alcohol dehydrogenase family protein [Sinorhizobium numidicum]WEX84087.1 zinc-binding alcohol dehydrogenase family protein [Sinorhizobium numidicum]